MVTTVIFDPHAELTAAERPFGGEQKKFKKTIWPDEKVCTETQSVQSLTSPPHEPRLHRREQSRTSIPDHTRANPSYAHH